ncbi:HEAT repeat domain-containing protein [Methylobacter sp.]|uniref:HEAT repeat domain-containing protein n=1 Tax=Methylobacter sp. TaxID=2051955 RepID=UPI002FDDE116
MIAIRPWIISTFLVISGAALSAVNGSNSESSYIRLVMTKDAGAELQLEVRQASLPQVLDSIVRKTGVRINYSVLPDGLVTAICVGSTVKRIVECLLDRKADLVFRYSRQPSKADPHGTPEEVWVLGAKFVAEQANSIVCPSEGTGQQLQIMAMAVKPEAEPDETDELVKMASSKIPAERAEAIGRLMVGGREGDIAVRQTLETALSDPDARVRVRAISSLAHREAAMVMAPVLLEALRDKDVSVRLTAVDNAGGDVALLQQALKDSDATVRQLAGIRLEPLLKTGSAE